MLWMGVRKHPLCPMCKSYKEMRRIMEGKDEYWECKDCKRKYRIADNK